MLAPTKVEDPTLARQSTRRDPTPAPTHQGSDPTLSPTEYAESRGAHDIAHAGRRSDACPDGRAGPDARSAGRTPRRLLRIKVLTRRPPRQSTRRRPPHRPRRTQARRLPRRKRRARRHLLQGVPRRLRRIRALTQRPPRQSSRRAEAPTTSSTPDAGPTPARRKRRARRPPRQGAPRRLQRIRALTRRPPRQSTRRAEAPTTSPNAGRRRAGPTPARRREVRAVSDASRLLLLLPSPFSLLLLLLRLLPGRRPPRTRRGARRQ